VLKNSIDAVDETNQLVYFSGNYTNSKERNFLQANLLPNQPPNKANQIVSLLPKHGWHSAQVNTKHSLIFDIFHNLTTPACFHLYQFTGDIGSLLHEKEIYNAVHLDSRIARKPELLPSLVTPIFHTIRSADNQVDLECVIYLPKDVHFEDYLRHVTEEVTCTSCFGTTATNTTGDNEKEDVSPLKKPKSASSSGKKPLPAFPTIVSVYGGPHVQRVANQWTVTADLRTQKFVHHNYVVIKCDNRGAYRRGIAFEGAIRHDMGNIEVQDQVTAVNYFVKLGLVQAEHVGMFGWSYGGYMSAMSLCRSPGTFSCAVAGAPVTSWDGYDTHYTGKTFLSLFMLLSDFLFPFFSYLERYMGTPQENLKGYADSSVMTHVSTMKGKLLLIHGLIDENVHFRHTARLINALIRERKRYELFLFPCERHSPLKVQDRIYLEDIMFQFIQTNL
jgi:hypothetical protein